MQIDDLTLTLFSWENIPPTQYAASSGNSSGNSTLGLLRISTDDGIEGHAFLGSATYSAEIDCKGIIHFLKPILMGADPLDREYLYQKMWKQNRKVSLRSIGAVDIALYDIAAKAAALPLYSFLAVTGTLYHPMPHQQLCQTRRNMLKKRLNIRKMVGQHIRYIHRQFGERILEYVRQREKLSETTLT
mgnify:CR=1 FL=1